MIVVPTPILILILIAVLRMMLILMQVLRLTLVLMFIIKTIRYRATNLRTRFWVFKAVDSAERAGNFFGYFRENETRRVSVRRFSVRTGRALPHSQVMLGPVWPWCSRESFKHTTAGPARSGDGQAFLCEAMV